MRIQIITVGDEILIGQIVDTNSAWMAQQLNLIGGEVIGIYSIGDDHSTIINAIKTSFEKADVILMTGGLGPTKDDITKKAIADYFGNKLIYDKKTHQRIIKYIEMLGKPSMKARREQCYFPENALLLENKMGTAPGMWFEQGNKVLVSMPGVPFEMKSIMEDSIIPKLQKQFPVKTIVHRTILTAGIGEASLSARIEDFENNLPSNFKLAYLPNLGRVRLRLTAMGDDKKTLETLMDLKVEELKALIQDVIFGYEKDQLEAVLGKELIKARKTISTAESCTGGLLAHKITSISGSSEYFLGSIVSYSNEIKIRRLNVTPKTLEKYGAVSEQTVIEMVKGALSAIGSDIAVSISGIAGPTGGTPEKPVGTIWVAVGDKNEIITKRLRIGKDRLKNIEYTVVYALNMARKFVKSIGG